MSLILAGSISLDSTFNQVFWICTLSLYSFRRGRGDHTVTFLASAMCLWVIQLWPRKTRLYIHRRHRPEAPGPQNHEFYINISYLGGWDLGIGSKSYLYSYLGLIRAVLFLKLMLNMRLSSFQYLKLMLRERFCHATTDIMRDAMVQLVNE